MTVFGEQTLAETVNSDPARFLPLFGLGLSPATQEPPAAEVQAGEPGAEASEPAATQAPTSPAPGAAQEGPDPATPPAGDEAPAAALGADGGGPVAPEEIEAGSGPAPAASGIEVTVSPGTAPMATCHQPYEHGWDGPAAIQCDVPGHHEDGHDAPAETEAGPRLDCGAEPGPTPSERAAAARAREASAADAEPQP